MANSITFDNTYDAGQVSTGLTTSTGVLGYTGSTLTATGTSYQITGTVSAVGSTVTVTRSVAGLLDVTSTATYDGYITVAGATYYVFSDPTLLSTGGAFAVSATGADVSVSALQTINQSVPSAVCFLAGSGILTRNGEVPVESILIGDQVAVLRNGAICYEPVRWIGRGVGHVPPGSHARDNAPVRISKNAFGANVPHRDLLVTPEHCVFVSDVLIPIRMLNNAGSIRSETALREYAFFHVELERHGILIANGLETESYLDTGNRANFHNNDVTALRAEFGSPEPTTWSEDAAAPLAVDRLTVEPIWNRLAERARSLGYATSATTGEPVRDGGAGLRIATQTGDEILPTLSDGRHYGFVIPAGSGALRLRSHSARPSDLVGPFVDDRRELGVQVGRMAINSSGQPGIVDPHLLTEQLAGWHAIEANGTRRWTNGNAILPLGAAANTDHVLLLDIEVVGIGPYRGVANVA